jgi:hypothetical protein
MALWLALVAILAAPQTLLSQNLTADEQSCRKFVQDFYDWYWNRLAGQAEDPAFDTAQLPGLEGVFRREPPVVSQKLIDVVRKYEREMSKSHTGEGGGSVLEYWDPFLNSDNGVHGKFQVVQVDASGDHCRATVRGSSEVQPELRKHGSSWIFVNCYYPDAKRKSESSWIDVFSD